MKPQEYSFLFDLFSPIHQKCLGRKTLKVSESFKCRIFDVIRNHKQIIRYSKNADMVWIGENKSNKNEYSWDFIFIYKTVL